MMTNIGNMMKQAQQLQKKMNEVQEKLENIEVEGTAGGGLVKVISSAKGNIKKVTIDETLMKASEKEMTEDLILAAINDAKKRAEEKTAEEMKNITGGIALPPGFKLPF
tara:strand:+ start:1859 stop:2185 length:327 start_codon:yes stop_codon:yes gene_type:complete